MFVTIHYGLIDAEARGEGHGREGRVDLCKTAFVFSSFLSSLRYDVLRCGELMDNDDRGDNDEVKAWIDDNKQGEGLVPANTKQQRGLRT